MLFTAYCYVDWYATPPSKRIGMYGPEESYRPPADAPDILSMPVDTIITIPKRQRSINNTVISK